MLFFYLSYHFCYNLTFYLYAFQVPLFPSLCLFFFCNGWYLMGFVWGFVFIAFDLGALHGIAEGKKFERLRVDVE